MTSLGRGRVITMEHGFMRMIIGIGCRASNGRQPGFIGGSAAVIVVGHRIRRMVVKWRKQISCSWMTTISPTIIIARN